MNDLICDGLKETKQLQDSIKLEKSLIAMQNVEIVIISIKFHCLLYL